MYNIYSVFEKLPFKLNTQKTKHFSFFQTFTASEKKKIFI